MTLTELRYIVAMAQYKHFGRAAARCEVSQPTLSIAIKKLEEELSVSLFDRSSNEIKLTPIGEMIVAQARRVLEEVDSLRAIAQTQKNELDGAFKLGLIFTVAPYLLPKMIMSLREIAPKMPLQLEENQTATLTEMLKYGQLDAIVVAEPYAETGIETIPLYEESFFVIVPKNHRFEQFDVVKPIDLVEEDVLLLTEGNCMRDQILGSCSELAAKQRIRGLTNTLQGSSLNTIRHMVASGMGISLLPATAINEHDNSLFSIVPMQHPVPKRRIILAYRRNYVREKALFAIRDAVRQTPLLNVEMLTD